MSAFFRSVGYAWSANGRIPVDLSFLAGARGTMVAPEIDTLSVYVTGTTATGSGTLNGVDQFRVLEQVSIRDRGGDRCNLSGLELRLVNQIEYGSGSPDPADVASGVPFSYLARFPFSPRKARRRADFRCSLAELTNGGQITITCGSATPVSGVTLSAATITIYAEIVDGGRREAKSRMCWLGYNAILAEDYYPVQGALRAALVAAPAAAGMAAVSSKTVDSTTLGFVGVDLDVLVNAYTRESAPLALDETVAGNAFPLVTPDEDQKLVSMTAAGRLHARFPSAPTANSRMLICSITDRVAANTSAVLGPIDGARARLSTPKGARQIGKLGAKASAILPVREG